MPKQFCKPAEGVFPSILQPIFKGDQSLEPLIRHILSPFSGLFPVLALGFEPKAIHISWLVELSVSLFSQLAINLIHVSA